MARHHGAGFHKSGVEAHTFALKPHQVTDLRVISEFLALEQKPQRRIAIAINSWPIIEPILLPQKCLGQFRQIQPDVEQRAQRQRGTGFQRVDKRIDQAELIVLDEPFHSLKLTGIHLQNRPLVIGIMLQPLSRPLGFVQLLLQCFIA
ncbi:hypothetical protein D3C81_1724570 [compost metagenome]